MQNPEEVLRTLRSESYVRHMTMIQFARINHIAVPLDFKSGSNRNPQWQLGGVIAYLDTNDTILMLSVIIGFNKGYPEVMDLTHAWGVRQDGRRGWTWCEILAGWLQNVSQKLGGLQAFYIAPESIPSLLV